MRLNMRELAEQNTMPPGAKQLAVRSGMVYATMLAVLASLVLVEPIPAHAAKVTISALFGWNARVRASVWCNPNAPPALPNATGTALDFFNIPGAAPNGAPLPPGCTAGMFANGAGGAFWTDASATAAVAGDSADGAPDLLSLLTPVNYKSTSNLTVSGTVLNPFSAMFHVTYSSSDIGSGSLEIWTDYVTGNVLSGADIRRSASRGALTSPLLTARDGSTSCWIRRWRREASLHRSPARCCIWGQGWSRSAVGCGEGASGKGREKHLERRTRQPASGPRSNTELEAGRLA